MANAGKGAGAKGASGDEGKPDKILTAVQGLGSRVEQLEKKIKQTPSTGAGSERAPSSRTQDSANSNTASPGGDQALVTPVRDLAKEQGWQQVSSAKPKKKDDKKADEDAEAAAHAPALSPGAPNPTATGKPPSGGGGGGTSMDTSMGAGGGVDGAPPLPKGLRATQWEIPIATTTEEVVKAVSDGGPGAVIQMGLGEAQKAIRNFANYTMPVVVVTRAPIPGAERRGKSAVGGRGGAVHAPGPVCDKRHYDGGLAPRGRPSGTCGGLDGVCEDPCDAAAGGQGGLAQLHHTGGGCNGKVVQGGAHSEGGWRGAALVHPERQGRLIDRYLVPYESAGGRDLRSGAGTRRHAGSGAEDELSRQDHHPRVRGGCGVHDASGLGR